VNAPQVLFVCALNIDERVKGLVSELLGPPA